MKDERRHPRGEYDRATEWAEYHGGGHDQDGNPARGLAIGVVLGAVLWGVLWGVVWLVRWLGSLVLVLAMGAGIACAEDLPAAPTPALAPISDATMRLHAPEPHRFLDRSGVIRFTVLAGAMVADGITTRQIVTAPGGREDNPLARPFVRSDRSAAGYFAMGFAGELAVSYWLHRRGRHRLERVLGWVAVAGEAGCLVKNFRVTAKYGL